MAGDAPRGLSTFEMRTMISSGPNGTVTEAHDNEKRRMVAIKQAKHLFPDLVRARRNLREVAILAQLSHPNICQIYDMVFPGDFKNFNEIYMVLEICDSDLLRYFRSEVFFDDLTIKCLLYGLLVGLNYVHSAGIWHRDLKPGNCLVNGEGCTVKICDFGLARAVTTEFDHCGYTFYDVVARNLTGAVGTCWYRAPEILLKSAEYTEAIDMWSVGCIFAELLGMSEGTSFRERGPLFPGQESHQANKQQFTLEARGHLGMILEVMGTPPEADIAHLDQKDPRKFMVKYVRYMADHGYHGNNGSFQARFAHVHLEARDLLERMLAFTAPKRITVAQVLNHPYLRQMRERHRETEATDLITLDFETYPDLDEHALRKYFLREICRFKTVPPVFARPGVNPSVYDCQQRYQQQTMEVVYDA